MKAISCLRMGLCLANAMIAIPMGTTGQLTMSGNPRHQTLYLWHNGSELIRGDTLRVRFALINTGDSTLTVASDECDLEIKSSLTLQNPDERCSMSKPQLAPGDSIWGERSWIIASTPGRYDLEVSAWGAGLSGQAVVVGRRPRRLPPKRLPYIVEFTNSSNTTPVTADDVMQVVQHSLMGSIDAFWPMSVTPTAAANMSDVAPYLLLTVAIDASGDYKLTRCWIGPEQKRLSSLCDFVTNGATRSPVVFGAILGDFILDEMEFRRGAPF
jgi:hypothetical protein